MLSKEEVAFFKDFIKMNKIQKIRHMLYSALLFSPLYLLTHTKLIHNTWDQEKMLKVHTQGIESFQ